MKKMVLDNKQEILNNGLNPSANNTSKALSAFYQKKNYEVKSFNNSLFGNNKPLDILYDKLFYGRVNLKNEEVIVDQTTLKTLVSNGGKEIILLNFVIDAYKDFVSYWKYLTNIQKVVQVGTLQDVTAKSAWKDSGKMYFSYMSVIYENLRNEINAKKIKIKNFDHFVDEFIKLVDNSSPTIPFVFSTYIQSRMADPKISGLCFDVKSADLTDDFVKYEDFLKDPNYAIFKKTAMKFGFMVDKQIPWRVWADIDSPAMKPYMEKYGLTQDNLYNKNYVLANSYDLELLRFYLVQFYNTYISAQLTIKEPDFKICEKTGATIINYKETKLQFLNLKNISNELEYDKLFMKLYVYVKARENNYNWNKSKFDQVVEDFIQIKEGLDTKAAMEYIAPLIRVPAIAGRPQRNFQFY